MLQKYHTIIKPQANGSYVGWVEEIPGAISFGQSLDDCRRNLKDALQLIVETHRHEARLAMDKSCILDSVEIDDDEVAGTYA